VGAEAEGGEES
jgi:hypothetical protein